AHQMDHLFCFSFTHHTVGAPSFASGKTAYPNPTDCGRKGWVNKTPPPPVTASSLYPVCFAVDQRPALDGTPVAGLPVGVFGLQDEPRINDKMQRGFVLEADLNRMGLAGGEDLDKIDELNLPRRAWCAEGVSAGKNERSIPFLTA